MSSTDCTIQYNALNCFMFNSKRIVLVSMMLLLAMQSSSAFQVGSRTSQGRSRLVAGTNNNHLNTKSNFRRLHHDTPFNRLQSSKDDYEIDRKTGENMSRDGGNNDSSDNNNNETPKTFPPFSKFFQQQDNGGLTKMPPIRVEDMNVLLYDVFLLVNLSLSISFWVTHRLSFEYLSSAFSEGSLLSILWIISGLYHGSFLMSAVDGHYGSTDERGGPKAAAALGLTTFVNTINLRLVLALIVAIIQHREVGIDAGEQLIPLEIAFGIVLMGSWRALHSYFTPRI